MVRRGISLHVLNHGNLIGARYGTEIIRPIARPYAGVVGPGFFLVHDNAQPHVARVCQWFLEDEGIDKIDWAAFSGRELHRAPLGHHGSTHSVASKSAQDSSGAHQRPGWGLAGYRSWDKRSKLRRCRACIRTRGGHLMCPINMIFLMV